MRFDTLDNWLAWQESLHAKTIDLGLDRVREVARRLGLLSPSFKIITVAGTNGKGSSVAMLESMFHQAGYRAGVYTSPHLFRYNERIRLGSQEASDNEICHAFGRIDEARQDISLTYFEFATLAAIDIFTQAGVDVVVLEVGLGGRLDAVNILDADVALITAIGIDHVDWLGTDRSAIGMEKAGIIRSGRPVVFSEPDVPDEVFNFALTCGSTVYRIGHDYSYHSEQAAGFAARPAAWSWRCGEHTRNSLPIPALRGEFQLQNAAGVLMALDLLSDEFPVNQSEIRAGLLDLAIPGRFQVLPGDVQQIFDVAHNPQAAASLRDAMAKHPCSGKTHAVFGIMGDKDIPAVLEKMLDIVDFWYLTDLNVERGEKAATIEHMLRELSATRNHDLQVRLSRCGSDAYTLAMAGADRGDRVLVFGSFSTVAQCLQQAV